MEITVLRYGHRDKRDERASMHVALVARAFGARGIVYSGQKDSVFEQRVQKVAREWGGEFSISYVEDWQRYVADFDGVFAHLTMYGLPVQKVVLKIRGAAKRILVMVGSQKVPAEAYELADFNVAVTNQPHSEIAALAVFLDKLQNSRELELEFEGGKKIVPMGMGKKVKMCK